MSTRIKALIYESNLSILCLALLSSLATAPLFAAASIAADDSEHAPAARERSEHDHRREHVTAKLVQLVRDATRQFIDVNSATAASYEPMLGCVSGPDHGAMGVHYVNVDLVGDGELDASRPEALIYEPWGDRLRLVGVEFIVDATTWLSSHKAPPMLEGQAFQFIDSPNRYGLPSHFELHVWAWRDNPNGAFVDWNTRVSCEGQ